MVALVAVEKATEPGRNLGDRVLSLMERVDYRRADTAEDREAIFRLRYAAYLREGAIAANPEQRFADALDESRNASIYGVYIDGELASSIRLHVATRMQPELPATNVFSDLLSPEIAAGRTVIDPTRFVADRVASRRFPELCYVTTRLAWLASEFHGADLLLATVRAEHQAFYRRVFGHRLICDPRHYPSLAKPICLMALDFRMARERVPLRYPFFRSTFFERRMLFSRAQAAVALRSAA
jgi:N-acyl amino acid synthase FeeM